MTSSRPRHDDRPVILWFRQDLRLHDQACVHHAVETGRPVVPVFILDEDAGGAWAPGGASTWWLHHSLVALDADLRARGTSLVLRRGEWRSTLSAIVEQTGAAEVVAGIMPEPWARRADETIARDLDARGVAFHRLRTFTLHDPETVRTKAGGVFGVYTPFSRACFSLAVAAHGWPPPKRLPQPAKPPASDDLAGWELLPTKPDWSAGLRRTWKPGEEGARARLRAFVTHHIAGYATERNTPSAEEGTSMLSPHLHFGEVSAADVWRAAGAQQGGGPGLETWLREVLWREFSSYLLWHHPDLPDHPLRAAFAEMPWRNDRAGLRAWQRGQTGIPIVDAGMRQLWQIGWMHNRMRMVCASFLVKHLLIPWQRGEAWFWDTLVDADLGSNSASWQWVAGCGADAAPYFRVFNPVLQGQKFDLDGAYVRRWVPELDRLDPRHIHAPWEATEADLHRAGVTLGETYPRPIVDLAAGRSRALAAYRTISRSAAA